VRFFLDHDVPRHLADVLRRHGHLVESVPEVMSPDSRDEEVFAYAVEQEAIMLTCNRNDFLALAAKGPHPGLIVLIRRRSALSEAGRTCSNCWPKPGPRDWTEISTSREKSSRREAVVAPRGCGCGRFSSSASIPRLIAPEAPAAHSQPPKGKVR
jgi:predicted nuclease of predicted toxin-antitoxin system